MTILDMLVNMHTNNSLITKALEIIKDDYTGLVNDNYEIIINERAEVVVQIPSLEKRNEFVYKSIAEYEYPLLMCMKISESKNVEKYNFIFNKFMDLYKDKLELFFKDVKTVDALKERIIKTKDNIDSATYASIVAMIISAISLCIFSDLTQLVRGILIASMILFCIVPLVMQVTKEGQVKKVIDGYLSLIKTEWYAKELNKQYIFLCNLMA